MLEEIGYTILPLNKICEHTDSYIISKTQNRHLVPTQNDIKQLGKPVDYVQTHEIKNKGLKIPVLISFLVFYVFFLNVIITCDVSVSDINVKKIKDEHVLRQLQAYAKDSPRTWLGYKYQRLLKNKLKSHASIKRQTIDDDKNDKYSASEDQNFSKYQEDYKNKDLLSNATLRFLSDLGDSHAVGYPHDLISNPFNIKKIKFNLRSETNEFKEKIVKLGVLLPADPTHVFSLVKVLPILEMAIPAVTKSDGALPGWKILVDYRDTECSSVQGPLAAFEFYVNGSAGEFYNNDYCFDDKQFYFVSTYIFYYILTIDYQNICRCFYWTWLRVRYRTGCKIFGPMGHSSADCWCTS